MTDDADLRARIEAQVAARRAANGPVEKPVTDDAPPVERAPWDAEQADTVPVLEPGPAVYEPDAAAYQPYDPDEADVPRRRFTRRAESRPQRRPVDAPATPSAPPAATAPAVAPPVVSPPVVSPPVVSPPVVSPPVASPPAAIGRATRWLLARKPAADEPGNASTDDTPAAATGPAEAKRGLFDRLPKLGRRSSADDALEGPALSLPDPDPVFDVPWGRSGPLAATPAPPTVPTPAAAAAPAAPKLGLGAGSRAHVPSRPVRPRPTPREAPGSAATVAAEDDGRPLPRPRAGAAAKTAPSPRPPTPTRPATARPTASIAATPPPAKHLVTPPPGAPRPGPGVDLSRFLHASETRSGDEVDEEAEAAKLARPRGGKSRTGRLLLRLAVVVAIAAGATFLLRHYVVEPYYIPSESMEPTLHGCAGCTDDRVLVDKISYRFHDPRVGDIIVFNRPPNAGDTEPQLIKRVIGVPGDKIVLRGGKVLVNGTVLNESYLSATDLAACGGTQKLTSADSWTIPNGELFVMGDNRCRSNDSRYFGPIKTSSVVGRAFAIFWPIGRIRTL